MYKEFDVKKGDIITFTGAGGKTSLMMTLANELANIGKVLITTTTKIYKPSNEEFETLVLSDSSFHGLKKNIFVLGELVENNKITGVTYEKIYEVKDQYDFILIEGDGAKEKIFKEWNSNEPCIPPISNKVIGVVNMDILNKGFSNDSIHRFELFAEKFANYLDYTISNVFLKEYIEKGAFFKNSNAKEKYIFFNGIDGKQLLEKFSLAISTANNLMQSNFNATLVLGSIIDKTAFPFIPVTAIVMASGYSNRMGTDKLKLKYNGVSLLENILDKLSVSNFFEIIVCGRNNWTEEIANKYKCRYLHNHTAHLGQSESIKLGVKNALGSGYMFCPADQIFLTPSTILKLYYNFERFEYITVPTSEGKQFSPVFFPKNKKNELLALEGDIGGKEIIRKASAISMVPFLYCEEFLDIDTPDEYSMIVEK